MWTDPRQGEEGGAGGTYGHGHVFDLHILVTHERPRGQVVAVQLQRAVEILHRLLMVAFEAAAPSEHRLSVSHEAPHGYRQPMVFCIAGRGSEGPPLLYMYPQQPLT
jgi:hypothetical protein